MAGCFVTTAVGACSFGNSDPRRDSAFESPAGAAEAFTGDDLGEFTPWDPAVGACRILVVGDSLLEATERAQEDAFDFLGCESVVDGLAARTLSEGWQCLANGGASMSIVVRREAEPGNPTCRPSGLELLEVWSDLTPAASATVIALGTNDAASFGHDGWIRHWERAVDLTTGPIVFVTAAARPGDRWVDTVTAYNSALRDWCPSEPRCTLASWDETDVASDPESYVDHVHLTRVAGEMRAVFIAAVARRVAVAAPPGPTRWLSPKLPLPPAPPSTDLPTTSSTGSTSTTVLPSIPGTTTVPPSVPVVTPSSDHLGATTTSLGVTPVP